MNALEIKLIAVIEILENKEEKIKKCKRLISNSELIDLHRQYYVNSEYELMDFYIEKAFNKSQKEMRK